MRKISKITLGVFVFLMLFSIFNITSALAVDPTEIPVNDETAYQYQVEANSQVMFRYMTQTRLTFITDVDIEGVINCEASKIGSKNFIIEVNGSGPLLMNMTCTEEQVQLGLMKGFTYRLRNRYRYLYEEGFCIQIQCNGTCVAKLKLQSNHRNQNGQWARYNEQIKSWETVATTLEEGFLVTETSGFSYWTILIPQPDTTLIIVISIGGIIGIIALITVLLLRKRK
ncbi:MAG: hypothetical protein JSV62_10635 [Promethearchaeota archaeon]|nr:MAG: hypothetical protein JSV62_10635 [Candidatus Lokiarchaeota archaeon]